MKKSILGVMLLSAAFNSHAFDESDASNLVRKYSKTVACQLPEKFELQSAPEYYKNQYKAVKVKSDTEISGLGMGAMYLVFWYGDVGCWGGTATVVPNFTVVEHRGFSSVNPVVVTDYEFPELTLVQVTNFLGKDGLIVIEGKVYGENDPQHRPSKQVLYTLKFQNDKFVKQ